MKKKFALLFLPVLMALTSCGAASKPVVNNVISEDTTACSEVFGSKDFVAGKLGNVKGRNIGDPISAPKIGYQIHYEGGKLAIRFVAAIKDLNVKAYWKRGVAAPNGYPLQSKSFADTRQEATKYYTRLSDGVNTIEAHVGEYADYEGFVVYTIHNIPYSAANKKAYVAAYVNLVADEQGQDNGAGGNYDIHNNSAALAVSIERKTESADETELKNVFAFDPTVTGHFLEGTINGVLYDGGEHGLYRESDPSRKGDNNAWYENVPLKTTDCWGSFYYRQDDSFEFFGNNEYYDRTDALACFEEAGLQGFNKAKSNGYYHLYVSKDDSNHIYPSYQRLLAPLYFCGGVWDSSATAVYRVYMWNSDKSVTHQQDLTSPITKNEVNYYLVSDFNPTIYTGVKFARLNPDGLGEWNGTADINDFSSNAFENNAATKFVKIANWDNPYNGIGWDTLPSFN